MLSISSVVYGLQFLFLVSIVHNTRTRQQAEACASLCQQ